MIIKEAVCFESRFGKYMLLMISLIYLFLIQYAPQREFVFSKLGFFVLFFTTCSTFFLSYYKRKNIYFPVDISMLALYCFSLFFILFSTVVYFNHDLDLVIGAVNNITHQVFFILFLLFFISLYKLSVTSLATKVSCVFLVFSVGSSIAAYQLYLTGGVLFGFLYFEDDTWPQLYGFYQSPNFFINSIGLGIISSIFLVYRCGRALLCRILLFLVLLFLIVSAVLSGSKGGMLFVFLSLLFSSLLLVIVYANKRTLVRFFYYSFISFVTLLLVILVILFYLNSLELDIEWLTRGVIRLQSIESGTGRLDLWIASLDIISNASLFQLLFGHGNDYIIYANEISTHNAHLKVIVEYGVLCYLILFFIFVYTIVKVVKRKKEFGFALSFFILNLLFFSWFRPMLNSGLFSAGLLGFAFLIAIMLSSYKKKLI